MPILIRFVKCLPIAPKQNLQLLLQQQLPPRGALLQVHWLALIVLGPGRRPGVRMCQMYSTSEHVKSCQLCKIMEHTGAAWPKRVSIPRFFAKESLLELFVFPLQV